MACLLAWKLAIVNLDLRDNSDLNLLPFFWLALTMHIYLSEVAKRLQGYCWFGRGHELLVAAHLIPCVGMENSVPAGGLVFCRSFNSSGELLSSSGKPENTL